jgi:glycosyltransferase involved in cell wall biosynthesis
MAPDHITPLILTWDEEPNIGRLLASLSWARRVVVVDSGSTDGTREIVAAFPNASCVVRRFDNHAAQWNFGLLETGIDTEWVLALDADYGLPRSFVQSIGALAPQPDTAGYRAAFTYCINGAPLRGGIYPPVTVLFRRSRGRYVQDGHTQRLELQGNVELLCVSLLHDDRKRFRRWFQSQRRYARLEARKLAGTPFAELRLPDKVRRFVFFAPIAVLAYCLFWKGNVLDGKAGWQYAAQRFIAEVVLSAELLRAALRIGKP